MPSLLRTLATLTLAAPVGCGAVAPSLSADVSLDGSGVDARRDAAPPTYKPDATQKPDAMHKPDGKKPPEDAGSVCSPLGSVTFHMVGGGPSVDGGLWYTGSASNPGDGVWWYSVAQEDGTPLNIFYGSNAEAICGSCQLLPPDAIGSFCAGVTDGGVVASWNGTTVGAFGECQPSPNDAGFGPQSCEYVECVPAGRYVVKMCVGCFGPTACVSVPFDFPTANEVKGTVMP